MDVVKAKDYLDRVLFHQLDMTATKAKKVGISKMSAVRLAEADAIRFLVAHSSTIGIRLNTPEYNELEEFAIDLAVNAVDAEYSH